jgi:hypothetical protein
MVLLTRVGNGVRFKKEVAVSDEEDWKWLFNFGCGFIDAFGLESLLSSGLICGVIDEEFGA